MEATLFYVLQQRGYISLDESRDILRKAMTIEVNEAVFEDLRLQINRKLEFADIEIRRMQFPVSVSFRTKRKLLRSSVRQEIIFRSCELPESRPRHRCTVSKTSLLETRILQTTCPQNVSVGVYRVCR